MLSGNVKLFHKYQQSPINAELRQQVDGNTKVKDGYDLPTCGSNKWKDNNMIRLNNIVINEKLLTVSLPNLSANDPQTFDPENIPTKTTCKKK